MPIRTGKSLAVIFIVIAAACIRLGIWQVHRLRERRAVNAIAAARRSLPAVMLEHDRRPPDSSLVNRRVIALGRLDDDREIVVRSQVLGGVPGIHAVTPLILVGTDTALLVNRGFVPSPDATTAPPLDTPRDTGLVRVEGIALPLETGTGGQPVLHHGRTSWRRLDLGQLRENLPYPVLGIYVRQAESRATASSFPRALPLPALDDGPHLNYAIQWFSFATIAMVFAGIVWRKRP